MGDSTTLAARSGATKGDTLKINGVLDIFSALILLAAISLVVSKPQIVSTVGSSFNTALKTAKG
ncbi:unannotated protein [freshwater metagenome]|uniref:Unannotated protein n=1 Tax=freshwater metagenome TaxID=449393 RepID=A0A6J5Z8G4_9ZZZZ